MCKCIKLGIIWGKKLMQYSAFRGGFQSVQKLFSKA